MGLSRREFLKTAGLAGAMLAAKTYGILAQPLRTSAIGEPSGASRTSPLIPEMSLVHADLHNHSHLSDGAGIPDVFFPSVAGAGLDVASLTDHSTLSWGAVGAVDPCNAYGPSVDGEAHDCYSVAGLTEEGWARAGALADAANLDGSFVAVRGFEWSSPFLGHMNVWDSSRWIDPLHTAGWDPSHLPQDVQNELDGFPTELADAIHQVNGASPLTGQGMALFYRWMQLPHDTPVLGGGADGFAGFNHPGRETGRFGSFRYDPSMRDRIVSMEIFNRREDYIFEGYDKGRASPLVDCLDAGWRVGLLGVTDEHGNDWGAQTGKGRGGLWVTELSRAGVRDAMVSRRFFATRDAGVRLAVRANGVLMGDTVEPDGGIVRFDIDLDRGPAFIGTPARVQVLRPGDRIPVVVHEEDVALGASWSFSIPLDPAGGSWVVLRFVDPTVASPESERGPGGPTWANRSFAYASPFWLAPGPLATRL